MLPHCSRCLQLRDSQPHPVVQSMQHARTADVLRKCASDRPLKVEKCLGHLFVVVFGVLPCSGIYCLWKVLEIHGFGYDYLSLHGMLGGYGGVFGGVSEGAKVVEKGE